MTYYAQRRAELIGDRQRKPRRDSSAVAQAHAERTEHESRAEKAEAAARRLARHLSILTIERT